MQVRFQGVRGSIPVSGPRFARTGGNTTTVLLEHDGERLILDGGTGLAALGQEIGFAAVDTTVLFTHVHWDHIQGVPFFAPLFHPASKVTFAGARTSWGGIADSLAAQMRPPQFPVGLDAFAAQLAFHDVDPHHPFEIGPFRVEAAEMSHPNGVLVYRVTAGGRSVVFATDVEHGDGIDRRLVEFAAGADLIIHDAQYTGREYRGEAGPSRRGWGHSTWEDAVEVCTLGGIERLALFHHDPARDDAGVEAIEAEARRHFANAFAARESAVVVLTPAPPAVYAAALVERTLEGDAAMATDWLPRLLGDLSDRPIDLEEVLRRIVDETTHRLDADRGTLYLVDHATRELVSRVAHLPEIAEIRLRIGEGVAGWVAERGEPVRVSEDDDDPRRARRVDELTGYRTNSMLAVPLSRSDVIVGVLQLLNKRSGRFSAADEAALQRIGGQVVAILDDTSLRSQLQPDNPHPLAFRFNHIVGGSRAMQAIYARLLRAAPTEVTVMVRGETGTGKELIARAVHHNSGRRSGPLVKVDCAALPEGLIENELFGHEKGAFTGADARSEGKVHAARGGTLFLDEIGELTLPVQGRLLRLLQDRTFLRVGGTKPEAADVRFVCATHVDLERKVAEGAFRQDLYYRLRVVEIELLPLRARGHGDLDRLVDHFLFELCRRHGRPAMRLTEEARQALHAWSWPGNVRELQHCLESAVILAPSASIGPESLPLGPRASEPVGERFSVGLSRLEDVERAYVRWALDQHDGNKSATATALGIGRNTLQRKLE